MFSYHANNETFKIFRKKFEGGCVLDSFTSRIHALTQMDEAAAHTFSLLLFWRRLDFYLYEGSREILLSGEIVGFRKWLRLVDGIRARQACHATAPTGVSHIHIRQMSWTQPFRSRVQVRETVRSMLHDFVPSVVIINPLGSAVSSSWTFCQLQLPEDTFGQEFYSLISWTLP